jgi:endonuclease/exonuclease/phosphatase (EEP) superfamily protein YafD
MKEYVGRFAVVALVFAVLFAIAPKARAQAAAAGKAQKMAALAKQLNLTPQQEKQLMPILEADAPKIEAIKNNSSLGPRQKVQQIKAIHEQSDPQVKTILNAQQYEQLQQIRQQQIHEAIEKKMGPQ